MSCPAVVLTAIYTDRLVNTSADFGLCQVFRLFYERFRTGVAQNLPSDFEHLPKGKIIAATRALFSGHSAARSLNPFSILYCMCAIFDWDGPDNTEKAQSGHQDMAQLCFYQRKDHGNSLPGLPDTPLINHI